MASLWQDLRHAFSSSAPESRLPPSSPSLPSRSASAPTPPSFSSSTPSASATVPVKNPQELGTIRIADRHWGSGQFSSQYSQLTFAMWEQSASARKDSLKSPSGPTSDSIWPASNCQVGARNKQDEAGNSRSNQRDVSESLAQTPKSRARGKTIPLVFEIPSHSRGVINGGMVSRRIAGSRRFICALARAIVHPGSSGRQRQATSMASVRGCARTEYGSTQWALPLNVSPTEMPLKPAV